MASLNEISVTLCCLIFAIISIIGNLMISHIILHYKSLKTSMNFLLLNLAVVDIITGALGIFYIVISDEIGFFGTSGTLEKVYNTSSVAAEVLCKVKTSFWFGSAMTPALLVLMALERYMAVVHPMKWRGRGEGKKKWLVLPCWLFGCLFWLVKILTITYSNEKCKSTSPSWYNPKVYAVIVILFHFLLPFSFIFWGYYKVIRAISAKNSLSMQPAVLRARSRHKKVVIIVVIAITLVFLLCSGVPKSVFSFQIIFPVKFYNLNGNIPVLLFLINSSSNPIICFTLIKSFRRKFSQSIKIRCQKAPACNRTFSSFSIHSVVLQNLNDHLSAYINIGCQSSIKSTPRLTAFHSPINLGQEIR